ncbi:II family cellulose-binding protein [Erysipelothrix larvae]|uniref:II family cellulose-binding protein n=1 Tax=Erysipelothrix larvae TaxID=1514105 RepID=A0A0X8GZA9_9FIRM|nr:DUF2721 domain-containing protein [Erysipelothrix larvae]AMC93140.1 II family cellulose-binding protein [Erysipelothrix larvae]
MEFTLQTPALIFPAISLLMLAYTNRFLTLAGLVRDLAKEQERKNDPNVLEQIKNLQHRMKLIRAMQIWGALAFTFAVMSMLMIMIKGALPYAPYVFGISLLFLLVSLGYLVKELHISIHALTLQLDKIKEENTVSP